MTNDDVSVAELDAMASDLRTEFAALQSSSDAAIMAVVDQLPAAVRACVTDRLQRAAARLAAACNDKTNARELAEAMKEADGAIRMTAAYVAEARRARRAVEEMPHG